MTEHVDPQPEDVARGGWKRHRNLLVLVLVALVAAGGIAVGVVLATRSGGPASPQLVSSAAGAAMCENSGFYSESKLTGEKTVIYDCRFAQSLPKCVTYSGNIASDATSEVSLLFAGSLNSQKPACLSWHAQAVRKRAAARAAARLRAYTAALRRASHEPWHAGYTPYWGDVTGEKVPNVYWKWIPPAQISCVSYATNGCWQIQVVTRDGCSSDLSGELGVLDSSGAQIETLYGDAGAVSPLSTTVLEFDADSGNAQGAKGQVKSLTCY